MDETTRGQKIAIWAKSKKGTTVGGGECWDLADRALRQAGADSPNPSKDKLEDYIWGKEIAPEMAIPGDILQFKGHVVTTTVTTQTTHSDGTVETAEKLSVRERPITRPSY